MIEHTKVRGPDRLRVYRLAQSLAEQVSDLLRDADCSALHANQLGRAAESLVLNIAESAAHFAAVRRVYHYQAAHGDAVECASALTRLRPRNPKLDIFRARTTAEIIASMLLREAERLRG